MTGWRQVAPRTPRTTLYKKDRADLSGGGTVEKPLLSFEARSREAEQAIRPRSYDHSL